MTEQEILAELGEIVEEIAGVPAAEVTPAASFLTDLEIDSLSLVEMVAAARDRFGVRIPDTQLKNLSTVRDLLDLLTADAVAR